MRVICLTDRDASKLPWSRFARLVKDMSYDATIMNARVVLVIAMVASHATAACSRDESKAIADAGAAPAGPSRTSSCDRIAAASFCSEWSDAQLADREQFHRAGCVKLNGTFVGAQCPNTQVIGSCTLSTSEVRKFYASGAAAFDAPRAESECTGGLKGKWAAFK
jgi:hypothetical protein